ncbi:cache domain-containing protein [Vallitaleaceae bacterium 9-2]
MRQKFLIKSISLKIFLSTSLLILVAITIISTALFNQYSESLMEQSYEKAQQVVELSAMNIESYLNELYRLSLSPYYNQDVIDALDKNINDTDLVSLHRTRTIEDFLEQILIIPRQDILRVFIFTDDIYKGERMPSSINTQEDYTQYDWYKKALTSEEPLLVSAHLEQVIKNPTHVVFSIVQVIKSTRKIERVLGVIKVDANYSTIIDICDKTDFGDDGGVAIIDSNAQLIYSNIPNIDLADYPSSTFSNDKRISFNGDDYLINTTKIQGSDWHLVGVTSIHTINQKILSVKSTAILIASICFVLSLIIIYIYLRRFLLPLHQIIKTIGQIQKGNLDVQFHCTPSDELGDLARSLNSMVFELKKMFEENDNLAHQIYEAKYLQKEAQINSLFSQIQPHFIYNTLNMISMQIQSNATEDAINNINQLSIMLRGLSHLDKDIPIATELDFLKAYLGIQKSRYIDRLDYTIDVDPKILEYTLPALSLQPIVENSVIHGCESKKSTTHIKIYSKLDDKALLLIVEDDGIGMTKAQCDALSYKLSNPDAMNTEINPYDKSSGIALINVNRRLQIKYGKSYGIDVNSIKNHGTKVSIRLPKAL